MILKTDYVVCTVGEPCEAVKGCCKECGSWKNPDWMKLENNAGSSINIWACVLFNSRKKVL